jgi:hypothetical protein
MNIAGWFEDHVRDLYVLRESLLMVGCMINGVDCSFLHGAELEDHNRHEKPDHETQISMRDNDPGRRAKVSGARNTNLLLCHGAVFGLGQPIHLHNLNYFVVSKNKVGFSSSN